MEYHNEKDKIGNYFTYSFSSLLTNMEQQRHEEISSMLFPNNSTSVTFYFLGALSPQVDFSVQGVSVEWSSSNWIHRQIIMAM